MNGVADNGTAARVSGGSDRSFGFLFAAVSFIAGVLPALHHRPLRLWTLPLCVGFLIAALVKPAVLRPLNRLWTALGALLNRIVSPIVTGVVYLLVVTPMGLLMRWRGVDLLKLNASPGAATYWIERDPPGPAPDSMVNQY